MRLRRWGGVVRRCERVIWSSGSEKRPTLPIFGFRNQGNEKIIGSRCLQYVQVFACENICFACRSHEPSMLRLCKHNVSWLYGTWAACVMIKEPDDSKTWTYHGRVGVGRLTAGRRGGGAERGRAGRDADGSVRPENSRFFHPPDNEENLPGLVSGSTNRGNLT